MLHKRKSRRRKWILREGVATIEFAVFLPVLVLVSFGAIQLSNTILLRHQNIMLLETGAQDYMLGTVLEEDLAKHIVKLTEDSGLVGATAKVTQLNETFSDGDEVFSSTFLELTLTMPLAGNVTLPLVVQADANVSTTFQVYRPDIDFDEPDVDEDDEVPLVPPSGPTSGALTK